MKRNRLKLPPGTKVGSTLTLVYNKELTQARPGADVSDLIFGTYHGFVLEIGAHSLRMLFIYSDGTLPEVSTINLVTSLDEDYEMVVSDIQPCPISTIELAVKAAAGADSGDAEEEEPSSEEPSVSVWAAQGGLPSLGKRR